MTVAARIAAALLATLVLAAPALWNGFPLLEHDTGGYLARWFEGTLEPLDRLRALSGRARPAGFLWPATVPQAALTTWVVALALRVHGLGGRPLVLLATVAALAVATALAIIASSLLTDIFAGLGVLALYLLVMRRTALAAWERGALSGLLAFAAATHSGVQAGGARHARRNGHARRTAAPGPGDAPRPRRGHGGAGARRGPSSGRQLCGRGTARLDAGRHGLAVRSHAAGRARRTLPGRALSGRAAAAVPAPPRAADRCRHVFWGSVFDRLGRFEGLHQEMRTIVLESLAAYPLQQLAAAASAAVRQLVMVKTGEGVDSSTGTPTTWTRSSPLPPCRRCGRRGSRRRARLRDGQPRACAGRALRDGAAARHHRARSGASALRRPRAARPSPPQSLSCSMPPCAACSPIRTTATARAWRGSPRWWC